MNLLVAEKLAKSLIKKNGLEDWTFEFDNAKQRFGCCKLHKRIISLSRELVTLNNESQVKDTILHEIAHGVANENYGYRIEPHGKEWKFIAKNLGCNPSSCYDDSVIQPKKKYIAYCPKCGLEIKRNRQRDIACSICCKKYHKGIYSSKYKLKWRLNK